MSERIQADLREAKRPEGGAGLLGLTTALLAWLKDHVPAVLRPVAWADQRIDLERAHTRLLDASARYREAEAHRLELENEEFSRRGAIIGERLSARLMPGLSSDSADIPSIAEATIALKAAVDRLQALGIEVHVRPTTQDEVLPTTGLDVSLLPPGSVQAAEPGRE